MKLKASQFLMITLILLFLRLVVSTILVILSMSDDVHEVNHSFNSFMNTIIDFPLGFIEKNRWSTTLIILNAVIQSALIMGLISLFKKLRISKNN